MLHKNFADYFLINDQNILDWIVLPLQLPWMELITQNVLEEKF